MILVFVKHLNKSVKGKRISSEYEVSRCAKLVLQSLEELRVVVVGIEPERLTRACRGCCLCAYRTSRRLWNW